MREERVIENSPQPNPQALGGLLGPETPFGVVIDTDTSDRAVFARKRKSTPSETVSPEALGEKKDEGLLKRSLDSAPPWLFSLCLHFLIMIVLAIIFLPGFTKPIIITAETYAEELGDPLDLDSVLLGADEDDNTELFESTEVLNPVEAPILVMPMVEPDVFDPLGMVSDDPSRNPITVSLLIRGDVGQKEGKMKIGGGTKTTQESVELALEWLARVQKKDGGWSLVGDYPDGVDKDLENRSAATAMALLAFQGNGVTTEGGLQRKNVRDGWAWLLKQQDNEGCFFRNAPAQHRFYTQGFCTIAICELYGMTNKKEHEEPARKAIEYCLLHQTQAGGWRYYPYTQDNDLSVTGWMVMAMQSARMAGMDIPKDRLDRINSYLDSIALDGGSQYPYRKSERTSYSMTAEGILCRQYLGYTRDDPRLLRGLEVITQENNLVSYLDNTVNGKRTVRDVYSWYYATQAAHHAGAPYWKKWNDVMRQEVPANQVKTGRERGSWHPSSPVEDVWADYGGRLYVTCLSTYMLEVYYRHLPIYKGIPSGYEAEIELELP